MRASIVILGLFAALSYASPKVQQLCVNVQGECDVDAGRTDATACCNYDYNICVPNSEGSNNGVSIPLYLLPNTVDGSTARPSRGTSVLTLIPSTDLHPPRWLNLESLDSYTLHLLPSTVAHIPCHLRRAISDLRWKGREVDMRFFLCQLYLIMCQWVYTGPPCHSFLSWPLSILHSVAYFSISMQWWKSPLKSQNSSTQP